MPTANVRATVDGWVDEAHPKQNNGGSAKLSLNRDSSAQRMAYIFFARPFPLGCAVLDADLVLHLRGAWANTRSVKVQRITERWNETQLRWNNRPSVAPGNAVTKTGVGGANQSEVRIDLTAMIQDVAQGLPWFGVRLELTTGTGIYDFSSAEANAVSVRPVLKVRYALKPAAPDNLRPSGGAAISKALPRLEWDLPRRSRDDFEQAYSQVQVSTTNNFTSPEYDSGAQANDDPFWNLADTAYAGVPDGATRYWRARIQNDDGQWSPWSDPARFVRTPKGVLTLVNPDSGGVVHDTTPPISWTFSGTQVSASVEVERRRYRDGRPRWETEWKQPRLKTTDTSWDVPKDIIKTGPLYRVTVRVWDDVERQAVGGDPSFKQVQQEFTYERDGTPDPVETLEVTSGGYGPAAVITWTRDEEPDWFCLVIDGEEVMQRIEPADVRVGSSDEFTFTWWRLEPNRTHTIEVEAVVQSGTNQKNHSSGNPVVSYKPELGFKYIVDDTDEIDPMVIQMLGKDTTDLTVGETAEVFSPVGARKPIRIVDSERGFEGTVTGTLDGYQDLKKLRRLKRRQKEVRFIQSTMNIPVILGEMSVTPSPDAKLFDISIEVFQTGEFFE